MASRKGPSMSVGGTNLIGNIILKREIPTLSKGRLSRHGCYTCTAVHNTQETSGALGQWNKR